MMICKCINIFFNNYAIYNDSIDIFLKTQKNQKKYINFNKLKKVNNSFELKNKKNNNQSIIDEQKSNDSLSKTRRSKTVDDSVYKN